MYNVTVIGESMSGKSSLCYQWRGEPFSESYCATILVEPWAFETMTLYEIPCHCREPVERYYQRTDVFVLVVREDSSHPKGYERLRRMNRDASWLLVMNGPGEFPRSRLYARNRGLSMAAVDLQTGQGVTESLNILKELTLLHQQRPMPVTLMDEVYQWIPACV